MLRYNHLEEMIIPKDEALNKITKILDNINILLGDEINDPIAIMCTYGGKQWSGHAKVHIKMCKRMELNYSKVSAHLLSDYRIIKCTNKKCVSHMILLYLVICYPLKSLVTLSKRTFGSRYRKR